MNEDEYLKKIKKAFEKCMGIMGEVQNSLSFEEIKNPGFLATYNIGVLIFFESMVGKEAVLHYLIELAHIQFKIMWKDNLMNQQLEDSVVKIFGLTIEIDDSLRETEAFVYYKEESSGEFLQRVGTDGVLWGKEFVKMAKDNTEIATDEETMIGWFCNAIEAGRSAK